ncbi:4-phosphopantetheinyl transferase, partial [Bacillus cereus]|uniref:4'-phosphopantetheinyl transferase family protein n=1 Tax=Bacillus cereus TaxID=1396 RepID=UPI003D3154CB|nr:4-phosphopantetheinyl transferase [Bacillus cereus]
MFEIYATKLPTTILNYHQLIQYISPSKQARIRAFHRMEDSYRTLLSELLIRYLAFKKYKLGSEYIFMEFNSHGKPFLKNNPFYFNTSHSGEWIVAIIGDDEVGIDVEEIRPIDLDIHNYFFSKEESIDMNNRHGIDQLIYFYDLW